MAVVSVSVQIIMFAGAAHSVAGNMIGDLNQDNNFVTNECPGSPEDGCWAVFDGHGVLGEHASRIAASTIELLLTGMKHLDYCKK